MGFLKNIWKHSRLRFYWLNAKWNYRFWLFAKKMFKNINYDIEDGEYQMDDYYNVKRNKKRISKRRFVGYLYKNQIYLDNPGFKINDRETWEVWKKKGLIK
jgi:hypothetical protein